MVSRKKLLVGLLRLRRTLAQGGVETKEMLEIYRKSLRGDASEGELAQANAQFQDLLKSVGLGILLILPFAPITLPLLIQFGKKYGVDVLPNALKKDDP